MQKFWCKKILEDGKFLEDYYGLVIGDQKATIIEQDDTGKLAQKEIQLFVVVYPTQEDSEIEFLTQEQIRFVELFNESEYFEADDEEQDESLDWVEDKDEIYIPEVDV